MVVQIDLLIQYAYYFDCVYSVHCKCTVYKATYNNIVYYIQAIFSFLPSTIVKVKPRRSSIVR